jgi:hypothetical protein
VGNVSDMMERSRQKAPSVDLQTLSVNSSVLGAGPSIALVSGSQVRP